MALQFNRTDATTGHVYTVYARIDDGTVLLLDESARVTLQLYDSIGAAQGGLAPVLPPDIVTFTVAELNTPNPAFVSSLGASVTAGTITSPHDALLASMYFLLKQRPAYSAALDV